MLQIRTTHAQCTKAFVTELSANLLHTHTHTQTRGLGTVPKASTTGSSSPVEGELPSRCDRHPTRANLWVTGGAWELWAFTLLPLFLNDRFRPLFKAVLFCFTLFFHGITCGTDCTLVSQKAASMPNSFSNGRLRRDGAGRPRRAPRRRLEPWIPGHNLMLRNSDPVP